jgi:hypothetical protein
MEQSEFVPCELCDQLIHFDQYEQHLHTCTSRQPVFFQYHDHDIGQIVRINLNPALNALQRFHLDAAEELAEEGHEDIEEGGDENDENYLPRGTQHQSLMTIVWSHDTGYVNANDYELNTLIGETLGKVSVGISEIDNVIKPTSNTHEGICPICQDVANEEPVITLCNHIYCKGCITKWLGEHKSCPVCLQDLDELKN